MKIHWLKWAVAGFCLLLFITIALNLDSVSELDGAVYAAVSRLHSPAATEFFKACTLMVGPIVLLVISLTLVFILPRREYRIPILLNLSAAVLLNLGLKHVFSRPRPTEVVRIVVETGSSFPSGHTMAASCFYGFLIYLVWQLCRNRALRNAVTALLSLVIALVGFSRVYLGVHYFTDVLAGLCVSVCYLIVFTSLVSRFFMHEENLKPKRLTPSNRNRLVFSFAYAFNGVLSGLRSERNMVIHFSAMATVVVFGALLRISEMEWIACIILFGVVLMAELINTSIETIVDIVCPQEDPRAKLAKDTAAGAVLMVAIAAAVIGVMIFAPKILDLVLTEV